MDEVYLKRVKERIEGMMKKASEDKKFRDLCLNDVGAAFKQVSGKDMVPGSFQFVDTGKGHDQAKGIFELPPMMGAELTDESLEKVAGGGVLIAVASVSQETSESQSLNISTVMEIAYGAPIYWGDQH